MRILIIDDDHDTALSLKNEFKKKSHSVSIISNFERALNWLKTSDENLDLIIFDFFINSIKGGNSINNEILKSQYKNTPRILFTKFKYIIPILQKTDVKRAQKAEKYYNEIINSGVKHFDKITDYENMSERIQGIVETAEKLVNSKK
ncbi:MAG: response regulator [Candidatus Lokiarchaeota archaeon]|nr:response regulator [Candidatus Lokiarchaeota archaeon]